MSIVGLIGGIAPESTIEYYRLLIAEYRARSGGPSYPAVVINSIDLTRLLRHTNAGQLSALTDYLAEEVARLARAGAGLAALASNTPHLVFDALRERAALPMVSIVEATADAVRARGVTRPGLFGTRYTMEADFYPKVFARLGMTVVVPGPDDQAYIHHKYMSELVPGNIVPETRARLVEIAEGMRQRDRIDGLILGGTELPLILREATVAGLPAFDTTRIHVEKIVQEMLRR
jgi:aspartate racemase